VFAHGTAVKNSSHRAHCALPGPGRGAVGIDYDEPSGKLLVTINSPTGAGGNFELLDPVTGVTSPFTALA